MLRPDTALGETFVFTREHLAGVAGDRCSGRLAEHTFDSDTVLANAGIEARG